MVRRRSLPPRAEEHAAPDLDRLVELLADHPHRYEPPAPLLDAGLAADPRLAPLRTGTLVRLCSCADRWALTSSGEHAAALTALAHGVFQARVGISVQEFASRVDACAHDLRAGADLVALEVRILAHALFAQALTLDRVLGALTSRLADLVSEHPSAPLSSPAAASFLAQLDAFALTRAEFEEALVEVGAATVRLEEAAALVRAARDAAERRIRLDSDLGLDLDLDVSVALTVHAQLARERLQAVDALVAEFTEAVRSSASAFEDVLADLATRSRL